jgi:replicative DNA helicase
MIEEPIHPFLLKDEKMSDKAAERAVLVGLLQYGEDAYLDIADFLDTGSFTDPVNQAVYKCIRHLYEEQNIKQFDQSSLLACANMLGYGVFFEKSSDIQHLRSLLNGRVLLENVRTWAAQIRKLQVGRLLRDQLQQAAIDIEEIRGTESIESILGVAESVVFDFSNLLHSSETSNPSSIGDGVDEYLDNIESNPVSIVGISSGMSYYDQAIGGGFRRKTVSLIGARPKALRYGSLVYTINGPVPIEKIRVGDMVSHPFDGPKVVSGVYDHPNTKIYRVHFKDGDYVDCCGDHLWEVYKRYPYGFLNNKKSEQKTTKELINNLTIGSGHEYKWDVPLSYPLYFSAQSIELNAYVLGLLIGDGSFRNAITFSTADVELIECIKSSLPGYSIKLEIDTGTCQTYRINGLQDTIRSLGLYKHKACDKFIPKHYIYNSERVRLDILRGLMDTDGDCTINHNNGSSRSRFSTISKQLAIDVKTIVQSLGGLCSITIQNGNYDGKPHKSYRCEIRLPSNINPFKLQRKAKRHNSRQHGELKRTIVKIEDLNITDNARCITIDCEDGLFITDNFVVTHNTGKSMLSVNIGLHISKELGIPVLYLDTEMSKEDHWSRMLSNLCQTKVTINDLEAGKYASNKLYKQSVRQAADILKKLPLDYLNVSGKPFEEIISIMRRWVTKNVGFDETGKRKDCVIIFDYMKMMSGEGLNDSLKEYQVLGFMMTALHNFAVRYDMPIVSFIQLNRDGIDKESTDVIAGSDRVLWLVTNFTVYKAKTAEEIADTGPQHGNRKLVPISARHGEGLEPGDYINVMFTGQFGRITEGETKLNLQRKHHDDIVDDVNDVPFNGDADENESSGSQPDN